MEITSRLDVDYNPVQHKLQVILVKNLFNVPTDMLAERYGRYTSDRQ